MRDSLRTSDGAVLAAPSSARKGAARTTQGVLLLVVVLSALDAFLTLRGVRSGQFAELNPLAAWLLARGAAPFVVGKMALALSGFWVLARPTASLTAKALLVSGVALYAAVDAYWIYLLTR